MYGSVAQARQTYAPQSPIPSQQISAVGSAASAGLTSKIPVTILVFVGLYLVWTLVHQHERVQDELEPKNIAANLHNLALIGLSAVVALLFLKLATAKLALLTGWSWVKAVATTVGAA